MKLADVIQKVMRLSSARRAYYDVELPKRHPRYPLVYPGEPETPPPPEEGELREFLESLDPDMVYQLVMLMHFGRESFGPDGLASEFEDLKLEFPAREAAVEYLVEYPALADQLMDALELLKKAKIKLESLPGSRPKKGGRKS